MRIFLTGIFLTAFLICATVEAYRYEAPNPTTEFEKMAFAPTYLTFSWEPLAWTEFYQVQVVNERGEVVRDLRNVESLSRVTDWQAFTVPGKYFWQVRVIDKYGNALSDWSERKYFEVTTPVTFAALGDSITHGGANFIPAGQLSCQWETFCDVPVKNIGRSGDTTKILIERFDNDVLAFKPKVLVILGGINDIREGATAEDVIANLKILRKKCLENKITPVFGTLTPMNPKIIRSRGIYLTEKNWQQERKKVNRWILDNGGIELDKGLENDSGELRADLTPDGLHPDLRGKKLIGEAVGKFLMKKFPKIKGA